MRAAASKVPARARSWQSQRVTRRSFPFSLLYLDAPGLAESVFQPVPSHSGQTSPCVLINFNPASSILLNSIGFDSTLLRLYSLTLHRDAGFPQVRNARC